MNIQPTKAAPVASNPDVATAGLQLLALALGEEYFAVEVLRVQEIRGYAPLTPIPNAPPCVAGVMNLRGTIVPVVDLRVRLGHAATKYTKFTVIVVVNVGARIAGLIVDSVWDVLSISLDAVRPPPEFSNADTSHVSGVIQHDERLVLLLDLEALLSQELSAA